MAANQLKPNHKPDYIIIFATIIILAFGLIMVLSSSSVTAYKYTENSYYYFYKQFRFAILGIVVAFITTLIPYPKWKKLSGLGVVLSYGLLLLVEYSDLAVTTKGSSRWLEIAGVSVQPSEIAKLCIVIFFAYILYRYPVKGLKDVLIPVIVATGILYLIYKQPDLGTAIVLLLTCAAMLLMTELSLAYFMVAVPLVGTVGYHFIRNEAYQWNRILGWLNPWDYATTHGYQSVNAQIAFGNGGLFGIGIGRSTQSGFLPENFTDTIFAVIGEEFGFFGTVLVLLCYFMLLGRAYYISRQCPENFGRLLGFGITTLLAIQTAINLCVVTGLSPVTGITLPLISYGGSSLLITMAQIGILLNISRYRIDAG